MSSYDLAIVGAGPAGISAALEARSHGLSVLVLDENRAAGGRIWESVESRADRSLRGLRPFTSEDAQAADLVGRFRRCGATVNFNAAVWAIQPDGTLLWRQDGGVQTAVAKRTILATGAAERPLPLPGWTLPGVMALGGAQILLKSAGLVPGSKTWIVGQGPLLMLYAVQVLRAGGSISGILDVSRPDWTGSLRFLPSAMRSPSYLWKGFWWRVLIRRAGVRWIKTTNVAALGQEKLEKISYASGGRVHVEEADNLLLHDGVIPSIHMTRALGCAHLWDDAEHCWRPQVDEWGVTSLPNISVAGDGGGVMGVQAAGLSGRLAALAVAHDLGRIHTEQRDRSAAAMRREYRKHAAVRPLLRALFAPNDRPPADDTIICRCEELTAGSLRDAIRLGCLGVNQLKAFTRCCMGPCQGRMCAPSVEALIAAEQAIPASQVTPLQTRFPVKPITVGDIAGLN